MKSSFIDHTPKKYHYYKARKKQDWAILSSQKKVKWGAKDENRLRDNNATIPFHHSMTSYVKNENSNEIENVYRFDNDHWANATFAIGYEITSDTSNLLRWGNLVDNYQKEEN